MKRREKNRRRRRKKGGDRERRVNGSWSKRKQRVEEGKG